jgi:hypothetical protein
MISMEKCRALLGSANVTDRQLHELREQLYSLARIFIESWVEADGEPEREGRSISKKVVLWPRQQPGR